ncbi:uncharacterized protein [Muntiacus reevesi]|uniref:uncharacterized protein n=1 Tax=Muntiacus reevesi TaxID=9886 RepID=UPI0033075877
MDPVPTDQRRERGLWVGPAGGLGQGLRLAATLPGAPGVEGADPSGGQPSSVMRGDAPRAGTPPSRGGGSLLRSCRGRSAQGAGLEAAPRAEGEGLDASAPPARPGASRAVSTRPWGRKRHLRAPSTRPRARRSLPPGRCGPGPRPRHVHLRAPPHPTHSPPTPAPHPLGDHPRLTDLGDASAGRPLGKLLGAAGEAAAASTAGEGPGTPGCLHPTAPQLKGPRSPGLVGRICELEMAGPAVPPELHARPVVPALGIPASPLPAVPIPTRSGASPHPYGSSCPPSRDACLPPRPTPHLLTVF